MAQDSVHDLVVRHLTRGINRWSAGCSCGWRGDRESRDGAQLAADVHTQRAYDEMAGSSSGAVDRPDPRRRPLLGPRIVLHFGGLTRE